MTTTSARRSRSARRPARCWSPISRSATTWPARASRTRAGQSRRRARFRRLHASPTCPPGTRRRPTVDGMPIYLGNPAGVVITAEGREDAPPHGRHRHLLRHGADQRNLSSRRSASCRSATASPWGAKLAALACRRYFDFETVIPCHYETFGGSSAGSTVRREMEGTGSEGAGAGSGASR